MNQELALPTNCSVIEDSLNDVLVIFSVDWGRLRGVASLHSFNSPFVAAEEAVFFSGQLDAMWSTLILRQNQHPLFLLRYSRSDSVSLEADLNLLIEDLDATEEVAA